MVFPHLELGPLAINLLDFQLQLLPPNDLIAPHVLSRQFLVYLGEV